MAFSAGNIETGKTVVSNSDYLPGRSASNLGTGISIRTMDELDLARIEELRSVVGWSADPRAFDLLRGMPEARWAVAELYDGSLAGMVGAVPLGGIGILCHLAVHYGYRGSGLGADLTSWAVAYLRSRGVSGIRLYSTPQAENIYRAAGFRPMTPRVIYRMEANSRPRIQDGDHRVEVLTSRDISEVCGVDLWSYGADRSSLILAAIRQNSGEGFVARDSGGQLRGYVICSATPYSTHIGPFMAAGFDVAQLLLSAALESCNTPVEATVTAPGDFACSLYEEFGFEGREDRLRMEIGRMPEKSSGSLEQYGTTPYLAT